MNKHLEQIIQLADKDKEIQSFEPQIKKAKQNLTMIEDQEQDIINEISAIESDISEAKIKMDQYDLQIGELNDNLESSKKKGNEAKNEREVKAAALEEEIAKEKITFANEEIERLQRVVDTKTKLKAEAVQKLEELKAELDETKQEVNETLVQIDAKRGEIYAQKQELVAKMEQKVLAFYEKIYRWAGVSAVSAVKNQACYGCYMKINDRTYADIIKSEEIVTCPHCGRILYLEDSGEE
ncbi:MAG: zinc ribbon domain-containing protein [Campylobacterota bacterium]